MSVRIAFGVLLVLGACGDAGSDGPLTCFCPGFEPDGGPDATLEEICDPVAQTGCEAGEKCASVDIDGFGTVRTWCVADGDVPLGGACTTTPPGPGTGFDDCVAGHACVSSKCRRMCTVESDSCSNDEACVAVSTLHSDIGGVGVCDPLCDPLAQDCAPEPDQPFGTGCYLSINSGNATCAPARAEDDGGMPGVQGSPCMYLNTCAVGYGCNLLDDPISPWGNVCAYYCDAADTGGPTCNDGDGPGPFGYTCVAINGGIYGDADNVPPDVGLCINCAVWADLPGCQ